MATYIATINSKGKLYLLGPYSSPYLAQIRADKLDQEYAFHEFKTNNLAKATQMYKEGRLENENLDAVTVNVGHKLG